MLVVFDLRQLIGHGADARPKAARRYVLTKRLVRTIEVIDMAPSVEGTLGIREVTQELECKHLRFERAMESLILAAALRVIRPAVNTSMPSLRAKP